MGAGRPAATWTFGAGGLCEPVGRIPWEHNANGNGSDDVEYCSR